MALHNQLGKWGEDIAAQYLREQGYEIISRDWRFGHRDIDIIARTPDNTTVVFVEVKTRTSDVVTRPDDAVDAKKVRSIGLAANAYVKQMSVADTLRFDVIAIVGDQGGNPQIEHLKDAFNPCLVYR